MEIKWNKSALQQLLSALRFIEAQGFNSYADELEREILSKIRELLQNHDIYPLDKYRKENNGSYHAFEVDSYRISYSYKNGNIRIVRIRHTSRRTRKY